MRTLALASVLAASLAFAPFAEAQANDGIRARTFAQPPSTVYEAAVALAVDRGYAEHGLVETAGVPVLLDLHQTLEIGGEHVDLYVRRQNGHARLLFENLRPEMRQSTRRQLAAYLDDLKRQAKDR